MVAVAGGLGTYLPMTLLAPISPTSAVIDEFEAPATPAAALAWPEMGASAIGAVGFDGTLAANGRSDALPIASISKVITALVVLDAKPLAIGEGGPRITFGLSDTALYDSYLRANGKVEPVQFGQVMTERDVLNVTLVTSANNYADSLARWAFGSSDAFAAAAAAWLGSNGFANTRIVEPTGMSPNNVSTAAELLEIGKLALAHPVIAEIVSSPVVDVPYLGQVKNSNKLLGIDGIDGIKTGTLDEAGACLLFSADYPVGNVTVTVVGVVLGGVDRTTLDVSVRALLDGVAVGFRQVTLATKGESFASYDTPWEDEADAVASRTVSMLVWSDTPVVAEIDVEPVSEASRRDVVGSVAFSAGTQSVAVPLELDRALEAVNPLWRVTHPLELRAG